MQNKSALAEIRKHEIPGRVQVVTNDGALPKIIVISQFSTAEIYLHGAQVTHFQKHGEPPLIFFSRLSQFKPDKAIRGGVPICFPWFGAREGNIMHGFARVTEWQLVATVINPDGGVTLDFTLPESL